MNRLWSLLFLMMVALAMFAQGDIPAHHEAPPAKDAKLPAILPAPERWGPSFKYPVQVRAYEIAEKIPNVLYQQPCYCRCDRSVGHTSLRSCFESTHGAHCDTCMKEAFYAYQMTRLKKTPAQIRAGILRGEWEKIDLDAAAALQ
ncbi:MAG: CYCXC family (seleno)protein [Terriglobales bacterium]